MKNLFVVLIWFLKRQSLLYCLCGQAKEEEPGCLREGLLNHPHLLLSGDGGGVGNSVLALVEPTF